MAGIKDINVVPGTGNPVQMQDLQNLWQGIEALTIPLEGDIKIISGFKVSGNIVSSGVMSFNGKAYYLNDNMLTLNQYIYANITPDDDRAYESGALEPFYNDKVINVSDSDTETTLGTLIGAATITNINLWKAPVLKAGTIGGFRYCSFTVALNYAAKDPQPYYYSYNGLNPSTVIDHWEYDTQYMARAILREPYASTLIRNTSTIRPALAESTGITRIPSIFDGIFPPDVENPAPGVYVGSILVPGNMPDSSQMSCGITLFFAS